MEGAAVVGYGGEVGYKEGGKDEVSGYSLQGSSAVGVVIWDQRLGDDGVCAQSTIEIPSSGR